MELILIEEFVERGTLLIIFLVLFLHDLNIFNEANQELLHPLSLYAESIYLTNRSLELYFSKVSLDHKVPLISLQGRCWIECLVHLHVFKLCLNVLLWENKNMEFFRFKQVWTFRKLLQEFCEQITSLFQKFFFFVAEVLLFGKTGYVQARKAFDKTGSESQEMLVASSDLERLSCFRMNTINDKNDVVPVSFEIMNREMPRNVICIAVSF